MDVALTTAVWMLIGLGTLSDETAASRHHHHHHLSSSSSSNGQVYCLSDDECLEAAGGSLNGGETCHWLYEGCSVGICMCDPLRQKKHPHNGKCIAASQGGDSCTTSKECPDGMFCSVTGVCECRVGQMTSDGLFCLRYHQKLVGSSCAPHVDTCYQRAVYGYTSSEVICNHATRRCECNGARQQDITCSTWKLHERGCTKFYHCEGGAICVDQRCVCPTGYTGASSGDNTKCVKRDAVRNLPLGAECDEIGELRYCAQGLVCHRCSPHDRVFRCVRFRLKAMTDQLRHYGGNGGSRRSSFLTNWSLSVTGLCLVLVQRTANRILS